MCVCAGSQLQDSETKKQSVQMELESVRQREAATFAHDSARGNSSDSPQQAFGSAVSATADLDDDGQDIDWMKLQRDHEDLIVRCARQQQLNTSRPTLSCVGVCV